jgi:hydrogenase expression/formation protein HypE
MDKKISLEHGDGGERSHRLIKEVFVKAFGDTKEAMLDAAILTLPKATIAMSTDTFVIKPTFFPGGSIGKLAVAGTVNDLAVSGAKPMYLTCGFVIEEGFSVEDLKTIVEDMKSEAMKTGVTIVAGDTKVVEKGSADGVYINTTGIGVTIRGEEAPSFQEGDQVILTGTLGDHGISVLAARGDLGFTTHVKSDCASLNHMLLLVHEACESVRIMRDPTRGGLATTLVELAEDFSLQMVIKEESLPIKAEVHGACDLLGFDPMYVANEGKAIIIIGKEDTEQALEILKSFPEGEEAKVIGTISQVGKGQLLLETPIGSKRMLSRLSGMMFPRIC